jgi:hypothetical protein
VIVRFGELPLAEKEDFRPLTTCERLAITYAGKRCAQGRTGLDGLGDGRRLDRQALREKPPPFRMTPGPDPPLAAAVRRKLREPAGVVHEFYDPRRSMRLVKPESAAHRHPQRREAKLPKLSRPCGMER